MHQLLLLSEFKQDSVTCSDWENAGQKRGRNPANQQENFEIKWQVNLDILKSEAEQGLLGAILESIASSMPGFCFQCQSPNWFKPYKQHRVEKY